VNAESFFKSMYFDIWQSNAIEKLDQYYSESFSETIDTTDENNEPITLSLDYQGIAQQSRFQKENYKDTTFKIKKLVASDNTISVHFYSSSIDKRTDELKHRCVCGIWHLDNDNKIDRVSAVVTPFYPE
jgi:hypothetical protein